MFTNFVKIGTNTKGNTIVFLHGWGCDGTIFLPTINSLQDKYLCYAIDFAGFGKSQPPPDSGWGVLDYVSQVVQFLMKNDLSNVTIVAHSFGCRVAMVLASQYPQLVGKMVLFAPAGLRPFSLKRTLKIAIYKVSKSLSKLHVCKTKSYQSQDYANCSNQIKNTFVKVVNQDLSHFAKKVTQPTLIIGGKNDKSVLPKDVTRLHKLIVNSSLVFVDGDHFAMFYSPFAFARAIANFCEVTN